MLACGSHLAEVICDGGCGSTRGKCGLCGGKGWSLHLFNSRESAFQQMENTTCKVCHGRGVVHTEQCPICGGVGTISTDKELTVEFNPAIKNPARRVIQSAGNEP